MMHTQTEANLKRTVFVPYYAHRLEVEASAHGGALTPAQELLLINSERQRTVGREMNYACAPTGGETVVRLPATAREVIGLREGRVVEPSQPERVSVSTRVSRSRNGRKMMFAGIGLMAFLLFSLVGLVIVGTGGKSGGSGELLVVSEEEESGGSDELLVVSEEKMPTIEATEIPDYVRGSRLFGEDEIVSDAPVSLEVGGVFLSVAVAGDGALWLPEQGVEWWSGTDIRRVFAVGAAALDGQVEIGSIITVRLRSGVSQQYVVVEEKRVHRLQTELLSARTPSILLIFSNEESDERRVFIGQAIQEEESG